MKGKKVFTVILFISIMFNIFLFFQEKAQGQEVDFIEIVASPGGTPEILDQTIDVGFVETGYAASFNFSTGYIGLVSVSWSITNLGGAQATTSPSSGTSSTFDAGSQGGTAIWKAAYYYSGNWYNDTVIFTINPPEIDYITIVDTNATGETEILDRTVCVAQLFTGYAAAFNNSIGYINDINVSWSVNNTGGAQAFTNPSSGSCSTFNASSYGGSAEWIADDGAGHVDKVYFNILPPSLDHIQIVDTPNTGANEIIDQTVIIGTKIWGYAAGFNMSIGYFSDFDAAWSVANGGGANASTDPPNGTCSQFYAGSLAGQATWTVDVGSWYTDTVSFTITDEDFDYIKIEDSPGGRAPEIPDQTVGVGISVKGYAAAYNSTKGFVGAISVNWFVSNMNSNASTYPDFGISSTFLSGDIEGTGTWIASDFVGHTDNVIFTITKPSIDYIDITDAPDGSPLNNVTLPMGGQVTAYASGYNLSSGYVDLVEVNWSGDGGIWVPEIGTSSTFATANTTGMFSQTGENSTCGVSDTFNIIIVPNMMDYIILTDSPNGTELTNVTAGVGEQITVYASGYNAAVGYVGLVDVHWNQTPLLGSFSNISGSSTIFTAGDIGGTTTVKGENLGLGISDIFNITINPPTIDYMTLTDSPNGYELINITLMPGEYVKSFSSTYNFTIGYIGLVDVNWSQAPSLGSFDNLTGTSTTFTAGGLGGFATITGENLTLGVSDSFEINVINATVDYIKIRDAPSDNGSVITNLELSVGQSFTLWAAAYNFSLGYLGEFTSTTWTETSGGIVITVTSPGESTSVQAHLIGGSSTITAHFNGVYNTTNVNVTPPTFDYIYLTESPNGSTLTVVTLSVGGQITAYASGYNTTSGFINLVMVNWSESNGLGSFDNLIGISSTFTAGFIGGSTTVLGANETLSLDDTFNINITPPTADYIQIRTQPGGGGLNLCDSINYQTYPVGASDTYYGAMYNYTTGYFADISSDSIWESSDTSIVTVTSTGSSSIINCDDSNWGGPVIITLTASGKANTTEITVQKPTVDYLQIRDEAGGLGDIMKTKTYIVWELDLFYAAGYNNTAGYLGEMEALWNCNDTAVGQVTSPGLWTNFTAQKVVLDSTCHVVAESNGITNSTDDLIILAPTLDFIVIMDASNNSGSWVADKTYNEGDKDVFFSAGFNFTADFVKDVKATWGSNNTIVGKVIYGPKEHTDFTAGWRGGYCRVTATYKGLSNYTGTLFVINVNQLPTAKANYYNGTGFTGGNFSFSTNITLRVTGRKENIITMELEEDGIVVDDVVVTRNSHNPDIGIISYEMDVHKVYEVVLSYNGHNGGSNPIIVTFEFLGNIYSVHMLFNSQYGEVQKARVAFNDVLHLVGVVFLDGFLSFDFEGYLVNYQWDFGDGTIGIGETLAHTYEENGIYSVTLTITDDEGGTDQDTITVSVENIDNNDQVNVALGNNENKGYLNASGEYVVILQCPADLQVINKTQQKIGLFDNDIINEIEGAFVAMSFADVEVYYIPKDTLYTFEVVGTGKGYYDMSVIAVDNNIVKKYSVHNVTCSENTKDTYIINFEEEKLFISTNEEDKIYSLEFLKSKDDRQDYFYLTNMRLDKNTIHQYKIKDWEELSSDEPVILSIDKDSDGVVDNTVELKTGLSGDDLVGLLQTNPVSPAGFPILFFIMGSVICVIGVGAFLTEIGKWVLLTMFLPLYTRLKKEELLDQPTRYKIYGFIRGNPGAHFGLIKEDLELGSGQLVYHLKQLEEAKLIYSREDGIKKRFYPANVPKPKSFPPQISNVQEKILGIINNDSGVGKKKISYSMGISRQVVGYHLLILERKGMISKRVDGRKNRYYPSEEYII